MADTDLLQRSVTDARLGGVCGGFAEHYRVDPLLVRIVAVIIIALSSGVGIVLYGAAWLLLPRGGEKAALARAFPRVSNVPRRTWVVLVAVAAVAVLVLVGGGLNVSLMPTMAVLGVLYASQLRPGTRSSLVTERAAPSAPVTPPQQPTWPLLGQPPGYLVVTTPAGPWRPTDRWGQPISAQDCAAYFSVPDPVGLYNRRPAALPQQRSRLLAVISGLAIAAFFAMLSLLDAFVAVPTVTYLATALVLVGASLVVGAFIGRPRWFIGIAAGLVLVAGATTPTLEIGSMTTATPVVVARASEVPPAVDQPGDYTLDLTDSTVDADVTSELRISNGTLMILLPSEGNYILTWNVSPGSVLIGNVRMAPESSDRRITDPSAPTLTIHATVTMGKMVVVR